MSIQTEIDRIITAVEKAHTKVAEKGGTTTRPYLVSNLEEAIDSIPEGVDLPTLSKPATAAEILNTYEVIDGSGTKVTGSMPNNGAVTKTLDLDNNTYTVANGYHNGNGSVTVSSSINTSVDTQASLISQIKTALEGKAAGGGGGSVTVTEGDFTWTEDLYEPSTNEYVLTSDVLNASSRRIIEIISETTTSSNVVKKGNPNLILFRHSLEDDFSVVKNIDVATLVLSTEVIVTNNQIICYGAPLSGNLTRMSFVAS